MTSVEGDRPRILVVSRRHIRKNKLVDIVGEYHLDLVVHFGGVPVIVPRVADIHKNLDAFTPFHGVLLCEGEDISPEFRTYMSLKRIELKTKYGNPEDLPLETQSMVDEDLEERRIAEEAAIMHPSDTAVDKEKDLIEFELMRMCLSRGIPALGICRGAQVLNVAAGGTLYLDVGIEVPGALEHIQYGETYDTYRHPVDVIPGTPLAQWFDNADVLDVTSYHHQGVKSLASRFSPMARSPDGLIEGFYDPKMVDPENGRFLVGLQFHPERMQYIYDGGEGRSCHEFEYPGCTRVYESFVLAAQRFKSIQRAKSLIQFDSSLNIGEREIRRRLDASGVTIRGGKAYLRKKTPTGSDPEFSFSDAQGIVRKRSNPEALVKHAIGAMEDALRSVQNDAFLHNTLVAAVSKMLSESDTSD